MPQFTTSIVKPDKIDKGRVVRFAASATDTSSHHELAAAVPGTCEAIANLTLPYPLPANPCI